MAIIYSNVNARKQDIKILTIVIAIFLFVVWLCTPPGNKFAQMCFFGNHTRHFIAKLTNPDETTEYIFHRNNAMYLIDMEDKKAALKEIDKAISTIPTYIDDNVLYNLYRDRANMKIFYGDYKGALDDYLLVQEPDAIDKFKIALLFKELGRNKDALTYCNELINIDANSYIGFACVADVYANVGKFSTSINAFDLLIDRVPNKPKYYVERALYKKMAGNIDGYEADIAKAKELAPMVDINYSITHDTIHPKTFKLEKLR